MLRSRAGTDAKRLKVKTPDTVEKSTNGMRNICAAIVTGIFSQEPAIQARDELRYQRVLVITLRVAPATIRKSSRCKCEYLLPRTKRNSFGRKTAALRTTRLKPAT